ncbi:hypothetical protein D3C78_806530 [compost metagenome]
MAVVPWQQAEEQLGKLDHCRVSGVEEHVVVRQLIHLRGGGGGQVPAAIAELGAPQAGHAIQVTVAVVVPQVQALTADHHPWPFGIQCLLIEKRMDMVGGVGFLIVLGVALRGKGCIHGSVLFLDKHVRGEGRADPVRKLAPVLGAGVGEMLPHSRRPRNHPFW